LVTLSEWDFDWLKNSLEVYYNISKCMEVEHGNSTGNTHIHGMVISWQSRSVTSGTSTGKCRRRQRQRLSNHIFFITATTSITAGWSWECNGSLSIRTGHEKTSNNNKTKRKRKTADLAPSSYEWWGDRWWVMSVRLIPSPPQPLEDPIIPSPHTTGYGGWSSTTANHNNTNTSASSSSGGKGKKNPTNKLTPSSPRVDWWKLSKSISENDPRVSNLT